jgi:serine protease Do
MGWNQHRLPVRLVAVLVVACGVLGTIGVVRAQTSPSPLRLERIGPSSPQQRAQLYQELERHAQVLEAQAAVVRIVAKLVGPAVVHVEADTPPPAATVQPRGKRLEETGSGVIVEWGGKHYVVTNRHVIRGAPLDGIRINLADGRRILPRKVWDDPDTDVAVLAIAAPDLVAAPLGDSSRLEIGDFVLAVGSPFGLSHSVTFGIISAKGRRDLRLGEGGVRFQDFLQTDAAINPGNSGGPLVNLRGEVVGIATAIASNSGVNEGIGFAIPVNMVKFVAPQLIERGKVSRGFLGVNLNSRFGPGAAGELGLPAAIGAHITNVTKNSPAEKANLQVGDVILEFNHVPVEDDNHLISLVSMTEAGTKVPLLVFRDRKTFTVEVELAERGKP